MGSNYKIKYNVDMVFCIDVTGSMDNIIEIVQNNAMNLYQDVQRCMEQKGKHVDTLRVRIIAYRDYLADEADAMLVTNFFTLPQEADNLKKCVSSLVAKGGGDDPEDGFEALAYAIKSKWNNEPGKKRHVIVLWTDDDAHDLGYGKSSSYYPKGMAADIRELTAWWGDADEPGCMDQEAKRFVLFAPDMPGWKKVSDNWDKVLHYPSDAGNGLKDVEYSQIISVISQTIEEPLGEYQCMKYKNCRNCGHPNPMDNRFCSECGTPFRNMIPGGGNNQNKERKFKMTILIVLLAAIVSVLLVILLCRPDTDGQQVAKPAETACTHVWIPANCVTPMQCSKCAQTNGVANGHKWIAATCTAPKICETCGLESGDAMGHQWAEATCTAPKICEICGSESGDAMGHQWAEATYDLPKTCVVCHAQEGEPLENPVVELLRDNLPIATYAMGPSRIIYAYEDASLTQKSNFGYIDADADQILITDISQDGQAVEVSYPSSAKISGYDVGWFPFDEIIALESIDIKHVKSGETTQTFRLSNGGNSLVLYGATAPRYYLGSHKSGYYMILYKIDDMKLFGLNVYSKIALVETRP